MLPALKKVGARLVAVTKDTVNPLARGSDLVIAIGNVEEACPMGLAPTASTAVLLAVGDALAMAVLAVRPFDREEYALFHPGGKLGRGLMKVRELMRGAEANPVVREDAPLSAAVAVMTETPGRPGACTVVDREGRLVGVFTDGDLRRHMRNDLLKARVDDVMTRKPKTVRPDQLLSETLEILNSMKVTALFAVEAGEPVGVIHVHDLLRAGVA